MNLDDLKVFLAVAEASGINRAAPHLERAPSNVSTRIAHVERVFGTTLFSRSNSGMSLTGEGEVLRTYAYRLLCMYEEALGAIGRSDAPARIRLGLVPGIGSTQVTDALASFATQCPTTQMRIEYGTSRELCTNLARGHLDGAFCEAHHDVDGLHQVDVAREVLLLAGRRGWDGRPRPYAVSLGPESACHLRLEAWYQSRGSAPLSYLTAPTSEFMLNCITAGAAIGVMPASMLERYECADLLSVQSLPAPLDTLRISFVYAAQRVPHRLLEAIQSAALPVGEERLSRR